MVGVLFLSKFDYRGLCFYSVALCDLCRWRDGLFGCRFSDRQARYFRYENHPWFSPFGPACRLFKFAPGEFVLRQKKVSKEKAARMPLLSCAPKLSSGVDERGFLPLRQRDASMHRPFGLIPTKASVLGAACGGNGSPKFHAAIIFINQLR
ncbi:hypothetical protein A1342_02280 [Methylomonas methanica]|uniref:Uncharacterized protein n=1 Tax=Methylomonas denitrificans TaxID=1538553 RepID=A0A140E405_9GAMM|nr:hypothetical protein JT25_001290 [Methylomonas denitrificans]OAI02618.1 hypothetical protein A1342_02280 [Methylomonas methanica]